MAQVEKATDTLTVHNEEAQSNHSHRHSKAYYKYRYKKHKVKKFLRKNKQVTALVCVLICIVIGVTVVLGINKSQNKQSPKPVANISEEAVGADNYIGIKLPYYDKPKLLVDDVVVRYTENERLPVLHDMISAYPDNIRLDAERGITLPVSVDRGALESIKETKVQLADNKEFKSSVSYNISKESDSSALKFLLPSKKYYYKLEITLSNKETIIKTGSFETAASPRLLAIDGVLNARDIGGWKAENDKKIKYGVLIRGSEIDGAYDKALKITDKGAEDVRRYLKIRTDFDLRGMTLNSIPRESPLGSDVKHNIYSAYQYSHIFEKNAHESMRQIFSDLADKRNYPIYLHCSLGFDRAGTVCYILAALLGVSEDDLTREFELSVLAHRENNPREKGSRFEIFVDDFNKQKGDSPQEKAENYLLSCGVTENQIESIKEIYLED